MKKNRMRRHLGNEKGMITLDFFFAIVMSFGFALVFFSISLTLAAVEVTQYVSFATARSYSAAHETTAFQQTVAENKYKEIMARSVFKTLYGLGWFVVQAPEIGDFNSQYEQPVGDDSANFIGARIYFQSKILNFNVPFLGETATNTNTGRAYISSYLSREVTTSECRQQFNVRRWEKLKQLQSGGGTPYAGTPPAAQAVLITDNGC